MVRPQFASSKSDPSSQSGQCYHPECPEKRIKLSQKWKGRFSLIRTAPQNGVMWDEYCSLPRLIKNYHNSEKLQSENYKGLKFIIILTAGFSTLDKKDIRSGQ